MKKLIASSLFLVLLAPQVGMAADNSSFWGSLIGGISKYFTHQSAAVASSGVTVTQVSTPVVSAVSGSPTGGQPLPIAAANFTVSIAVAKLIPSIPEPTADNFKVKFIPKKSTLPTIEADNIVVVATPSGAISGEGKTGGKAEVKITATAADSKFPVGSNEYKAVLAVELPNGYTSSNVSASAYVPIYNIPSTPDPIATKAPYIVSVSPSSAYTDEQVEATLSGLQFEAKTAKVEFVQNGVVKASITPKAIGNVSYLGFTLEKRFLANIAPGTYKVRVAQAGLVSNEVNFTVSTRPTNPTTNPNAVPKLVSLSRISATSTIATARGEGLTGISSVYVVAAGQTNKNYLEWNGETADGSSLGIAFPDAIPLKAGKYNLYVVTKNGTSNGFSFELQALPSSVGPISISHQSNGEYFIYNSRYDLVTLTAQSPIKSPNYGLEWRLTFTCTGSVQVSVLGVGGPENYCNGRSYDVKNNTLSNDTINIPFAAKRINAGPASVKVKVQLYNGDQKNPNKMQEGTYDIALAAG